jgi:hypothetical protein
MTTLPCPGCARGVALPDNDARAEVRCPACGMTFDRPDAITAAPPRKSRAIRSGQPKAHPQVVTCEHCGETLRAAERDDRPLRCPVCGNLVPARSRQITAKPPPIKAPPIRAASTEITAAPSRTGPVDEDDGEQPYHFESPPRNCPRCERELDDGAVLCLKCGYNAQTGEQAVREYEPVERSWDGGLSLRRRLVLLGVGQTIAIGMLIGAALGDFLVAAVAAWLFGTLLLAYTMGTFCRIEVARSTMGKVKLVKAWRFCFVPVRPVRINPQLYNGVTTGMAHGADLWDWIVLLTLSLYGLIPGLIWWYWAFHRDTFYVGLVRDHGNMALELYRGWDQDVMHDIARVVREVGGYAT